LFDVNNIGDGRYSTKLSNWINYIPKEHNKDRFEFQSAEGLEKFLKDYEAKNNK
jgi:hypothetical protein